MKALLLLVTLALAWPAGAQTTVRPEAFAHHALIRTSGPGPFHQLDLPMAVYQGASKGDLGDLRVFNARSEMLPYALVRSQSQVEARLSEQAVPFFALPPVSQASQSGDLSVTVRQGTDGTLVALHQALPAARPGSASGGVVIDASRLKGSIRSLRLSVGATTVPFHAYRIESSEDLQHWRLLKGDAQLVHLAQAGQQIVRDTAEWDGGGGKYLRLLWADPQQAPAIKSIQLGVLETDFQPPARLWSAALQPSTPQANVYEYAIPGQMPLESLRINLPQINTLLPLDIQREVVSMHHRREHRRWETLARTVAYRLASPQGELKSEDLSLHGGFERRLRLDIDARGGNSGAAPPTVQIGFVPHRLVFLASGDGPYRLYWGASEVAGGELPASTLMPSYQGRGRLPAEAATLVVEADNSHLAAAPETKVASGSAPEAGAGSSRWLLWGILLVGLLVLGGMALSLSRQIRQGRKTEP